MKIQHRPFFGLATNENSCGSGISAFSSLRFRLLGRIAVICMAVLICSCASLTPDRIQVLAAIAGQAAQLGAEAWLRDHPDQRAGFDLVIAQIRLLVGQGVIDPARYVVLLESLPTSQLSAPSGQLMWSGVPKSGVGTAKLFVWDGELQKTVPIKDEAVLTVMKAASSGLRIAVAPRPPMPRVNRPLRTVAPEPVLPDGIIIPEATVVLSNHVPVIRWYHMPWTNYTNINIQFNSNTIPVAEVNDATLDAEFQRYLATKTNAVPTRNIRIIRPVGPQGYRTNEVETVK